MYVSDHHFYYPTLHDRLSLLPHCANFDGVIRNREHTRDGTRYVAVAGPVNRRAMSSRVIDRASSLGQPHLICP
jgi:hypothetical protein